MSVQPTSSKPSYFQQTVRNIEETTTKLQRIYALGLATLSNSETRIQAHTHLRVPSQSKVLEQSDQAAFQSNLQDLASGRAMCTKLTEILHTSASIIRFHTDHFEFLIFMLSDILQIKVQNAFLQKLYADSDEIEGLDEINYSSNVFLNSILVEALKPLEEKIQAAQIALKKTENEYKKVFALHQRIERHVKTLSQTLASPPKKR